MRRDLLDEAIEEAQRFLKRAKALKKEDPKPKTGFVSGRFSGGMRTAAVRRSSLDLSKALSALRKTAGH